ncbi:TPA: hypothetical protein HA249_07525 [Candidatus Woesearchaeota archaeon]|nr:hypothetical protein [Candidatus Woesearchaeota archaeon]HIH47550.1 hypothetical protein [Candidatus Woesearchaeota archaeon]
MPSMNRVYGRVSLVRQVKYENTSTENRVKRYPVAYVGIVQSLGKDGGNKSYRFRTHNRVMKGQEVMFVPMLTGIAKEGSVVPVTGYGSA